LVEGTARFYLHVARLFASERRGKGIDWRSLRAVKSACQVVSALHCLLRYLRLEGVTGLALDDAVLSVARWNSSLPQGISSAAVRTPGNHPPLATSAVPRR
jgi:hypothetical protein